MLKILNYPLFRILTLCNSKYTIMPSVTSFPGSSIPRERGPGDERAWEWGWLIWIRSKAVFLWDRTRNISVAGVEARPTFPHGSFPVQQSTKQPANQAVVVLVPLAAAKLGEGLAIETLGVVWRQSRRSLAWVPDCSHRAPRNWRGLESGLSRIEVPRWLPA